MTEWPRVKSVKQIVDDGLFPGTERQLIDLAKKYQIGRMFGRMVAFTDQDWADLLERLPVPGQSEQSRSWSRAEAPMAPEKAYRLALAMAEKGRPKSARSGA
ncbi:MULTISPECIES: hypothetical protein [Asticcacaulis]|uniref:hypothetical protein n=1 Tax=Asticcacaulis TaxID=76890 RepID=UPI001AE7090F|nr:MULTISPECIES: hypothetical protein [Asticcacaulis]MBP2159580.1 hypothetical protein [Asticcacaulis solisilvae]MDR6800593.1 hypothetical protein [Asticcacaulis sp. BE141]